MAIESIQPVGLSMPFAQPVGPVRQVVRQDNPVEGVSDRSVAGTPATRFETRDRVEISSRARDYAAMSARDRETSGQTTGYNARVNDGTYGLGRAAVQMASLSPAT